MYLWNKVGIPHKGWEYVGIVDLGENTPSGEEVPYEHCELCGNERIRYVHILKHPKYNGELRVGCDCASKLLNNYNEPQDNERHCRNRTNRKTNFMKREWKFVERTGNYTLKYKGENITIMKSKYGPTWGIVYRGKSTWNYDGGKIYDFDTAKHVAFNMFDENYD